MSDFALNFYYRDKIKIEFPEGTAWKIFANFKVVHASFSSNDSSKCWAIVEVMDKQSRNLQLVVCQNFSTEYNLTESDNLTRFKWMPVIKNAFKYISC